jgi:hypothetical protein
MGVLTDKEQAIADFAQEKRKLVVDVISQNGVPTSNPELLKIMVTTLQHLDASNISQAKLRLAEGTREDAKAQMALVTELLKNVRPGEGASAVPALDRVIPSLPEDVDILRGITPEELKLPEAMGSAEATYDASDADA